MDHAARMQYNDARTSAAAPENLSRRDRKYQQDAASKRVTYKGKGNVSTAADAGLIVPADGDAWGPPPPWNQRWEPSPPTTAHTANDPRSQTNNTRAIMAAPNTQPGSKQAKSRRRRSHNGGTTVRLAIGPPPPSHSPSPSASAASGSTPSGQSAPESVSSTEVQPGMHVSNKGSGHFFNYMNCHGHFYGGAQPVAP